MTDMRDMVAQLTPEQKRELAKRLLRDRDTSASAVAVAGPEGALAKSLYRLDHHPIYLGLVAAGDAVPALCPAI